MPIYELEPRVKVVLFGFGHRVGHRKEIDSVVLLKEKEVFDGIRHSIVARVIGPDSVIVNSYSYDGKPSTRLTGPEINEDPRTRGKLRWVPGFTQRNPTWEVR